MSFSRYQELALYHPQAGFYAGRGSAGRSGDFITSPEVGGLFGHVLALALERWWRRLGRPEPFFVIEVGAGVGTLAATILEAEPKFGRVLRYVAVERSGALLAEHTGRLPSHPLEEVLDTSPTTVKKATGPLVAGVREMPKGRFVGVVLANELLDNLPVDLYERRNREWYAVKVGVTRDGGLEDILVPLESADPAGPALERFAPNAREGARVPLQTAAQEWLAAALGILERGKVVIFDYAHSTRWMADRPWDNWLRTYKAHRPGGSPLESPGTQDITCDVAVDQLAAIRAPARDSSQVDFLEAHGLFDLIADAREAWHTRAAMGDMGAMRARARVQEGRALSDPNGLGAHRVLEWDVPDGPD